MSIMSARDQGHGRNNCTAQESDCDTNRKSRTIPKKSLSDYQFHLWSAWQELDYNRTTEFLITHIQKSFKFWEWYLNHVGSIVAILFGSSLSNSKNKHKSTLWKRKLNRRKCNWVQSSIWWVYEVTTSSWGQLEQAFTKRLSCILKFIHCLIHYTNVNFQWADGPSPFFTLLKHLAAWVLMSDKLFGYQTQTVVLQMALSTANIILFYTVFVSTSYGHIA